MRRQTFKRSARLRHTSRATHRLKAPPGLEHRLAEILTDLARVLIASGYGIAGLTRLARQAFVDAALGLEQAGGRRQSHARIAALTGLTRVEVSQLSRSGTSPRARGVQPVNRAQRVSLGWISDEKYCGNAGQPRILPFAGSRASFEKLVKTYSGDIPARAMLSEMIRLGMAREAPDKSIRLVRSDCPVPRHTTTALRAISPWTRFLAESTSDEARELHANSVRVTLSFESLPQLFSAVRELQDRAQAFVTSVHELAAHGKASRSHKLQVSIALATRIPKVDRLNIRKKLGSRNG